MKKTVKIITSIIMCVCIISMLAVNAFAGRWAYLTGTLDGISANASIYGLNYPANEYANSECEGYIATRPSDLYIVVNNSISVPGGATSATTRYIGEYPLSYRYFRTSYSSSMNTVSYSGISSVSVVSTGYFYATSNGESMMLPLSYQITG